MNDLPTKPAEESDDRKVRQVEILISVLLRAGVIASLAIVAAGTIVSFVRHPQYIHHGDDLARLTTPSRAAFPDTLGQMFDGLRRFEGRSIVIAGLLLLIATPVMRVAVSIFAFIYEKDGVFVVITSIVLALLIISFFIGKPV